ncbi:MAG: hypothetical protein LBD45_09585 [Bacteroidales bacterium]|jgi:ABC-type uncharacterized transport system permease subunit|nr:hypothetical protein [Bacteroidales bacterium]
MKKIFLALICLAAFAGTSMAQYSTNRTGNLVDDMRTNAPDLYKSYRSGNKLRNVGMGLTIGGIAATIVGVAVADKKTTTTSTGTQVNLSGTGAAVFVVGVVGILAGTPTWIIGGSKKRRAKNAYLKKYSYEPSAPYLKLNSSADGIGLALVF